MEEGVELHHFAEGEGEEILVVHGGPGIPPQDPFPGLSRLSHRYRFHYYHQRGCGKSTRPVQQLEGSLYTKMTTLERRLGLSAQLADIERIRRILKKDRLTLVGHSYGGFLAAMYAAEFPGHVERLILVVPASVLQIPPVDGGLYHHVREGIKEESVGREYDAYLQRLMDFESVLSMDESSLAALNREFVSFYERAAREISMEMEGETPPDWIGGFVQQANFLSLGRESDFRKYMKRIRVPTLLIAVGRDLSPASATDSYKTIPRLTYTLMEESGHFPFYDQPEQFARILRQFLER